MKFGKLLKFFLVFGCHVLLACTIKREGKIFLEVFMGVIGRTQDGAVVVDRANSHLHECARKFIGEAVSKVKVNGRAFIEAEVDFGRVIGSSICVQTDQGDDIVFAQRPNRKGLTRFVVGRDPEPTSKFMVVLKATDDPQKYVLITAFLGSKAQPEPWDPRATVESIKFWQNRALVWGSEYVVDGTKTTECPW